MEQLRRLRSDASHPDSPHILSNLLSSHSSEWPTRELILTFQDIYKSLPEPAKVENNEAIRRLRIQIKEATPSIAELIGTDNRAGFIDASTGKNLTHLAIRQFVQGFHIPVRSSSNGKPRVAVILPNGLLMAVAVFAFANRYTIVPMASNTVPEQLHMDVEQVQADAVVALENDIEKLKLDNGVRPIFGLEQLEDLTFRVVSEKHNSTTSSLTPNVGDDIAIILFTSGTSGKKKLVPITTFNLIAGTIATMESVELSEKDTCLNMMPLNHVYVPRPSPTIYNIHTKQHQWRYNAQYSFSYSRRWGYDMLSVLRPQHVLGCCAITHHDPYMVLRHADNASDDSWRSRAPS